MINYDITDLRLFLAAAKHGQLKPAADAVFLTVSAASLRIKKLEATFHVQFFTRLPRGLALTPAGERFSEEARLLMLQAENLERGMQIFNGRREDTIRLYANYGGLNGALHADIGDFLAAHPDIRVDFSLRTSVGVIEGVIDGAADVGVANYTRGELIPREDEVEFFEYFKDTYGLLVEENHPQLQHFGETVSLKELENFPLVALNAELVSQEWFENHAKELGLHLNIRARFPSIRAGFETMKRIGGGMLVLRSSYAAQEPGFKFVELSDVWRRLDNRICIPKDRSRMRPVALELTSFLIECAKQHADETYRSETTYVLGAQKKKL